MRLLVDNALSPSIAEGLTKEGHNAIHVRDAGIAASSDLIIMNYALQNNRIIVSADTDFGTLLALREHSKPSFILFRQSDKSPSTLLMQLMANLEQFNKDLEKGAVIVIEDTRIRVKNLPISGPE